MVKLMEQTQVSARVCQADREDVGGHPSIFPAPLHYRSLQALKHRALAVAGYDGQIAISPEASEDLLWWASNLSLSNGRTASLSSPQVAIETDASMLGWGAYTQGEATGGCWSERERKLHINALKLLAVFFALKAFLKTQEGMVVLILTDNMSVVSYVNKLGGGTKSNTLAQLTKEMFPWCIERKIRLLAQHLPGKANIRADYMSRHLRDRTDWVLNQDIFRAINTLWGPLEVDLFASRFSAQLPLFFWRADPEAEATDAFKQTGLCSPTMVPNNQGVGKGASRRSNDNFGNTTMEDSTVVSCDSAHAGGLASIVARYPRPHHAFPQLRLSNGTVPSSTSRLEGQFRAKKIPDKAIDLIMSSWRRKRVNNYNSAWKLWEEWCQEKGVHPFSADVPHILAFYKVSLRRRSSTAL